MDNREIVMNLVSDFFGSTKKAELWMNSKNPLLGGISPEFMIKVGRSDRLLKFVKTQLDENRMPNELR